MGTTLIKLDDETLVEVEVPNMESSRSLEVWLIK